jgi:hypothetical protein
MSIGYKERYETISPKFVLYLGVVGNACMLVFFTFLFQKLLFAEDVIPLFLVMFLAGIWLTLLLFVFFKSVYLIVDRKEKVIQYGNFFFNQEAPLHEVGLVKKSIWARDLYKIEITKKSHYFISPRNSLQKIAKVLDPNDHAN